MFAGDGVVGRLLVVEAWVLCLDGRQSQLDGLVKQVPKHMEPAHSRLDSITPFKINTLCLKGFDLSQSLFVILLVFLILNLYK